MEDKIEEYSISNDTMQTEVDLQILEQDYQDEYTATLAANQEIEEAAAELALQLGESAPGEDGAAVAPDIDLTAEMPAEPTREMPADPGLEPTALKPTVEAPLDPGLDPTAEMSVSTSDSGVNAELTDAIPVDTDALNDALASDEDVTAKIAAAGSDVTVEMPAGQQQKEPQDSED